MESKIIELDSTYRDRNINPHPADFRLDVNLPDKYSCIDAYDPVSVQAPFLSWTGNTVDASLSNVLQLQATVISCEGNNAVILSIPFQNLFQINQYYRGLCSPTCGFVSDYFPISNNLGRFRFTKLVPDVGDALVIDWPVDIPPVLLPGLTARFFVPSMYGCRARILYNETTQTACDIIDYPTAHSITVSISVSGWQYDHKYSLRNDIPATVDTIVAATSMTLTVTTIPSYIGDIVYVPDKSYYGVISSINGFVLTLANPIVNPATWLGLKCETLNFSYDNYQALRHNGTPNLQERTWKVWIFDVQIPNQPVLNSKSLQDFSTLYLEFRDQHSVQDSIMTNNPNGQNALFRLTADASSSTRSFVTYSAPKVYKTFRFSPNRSYFFIRITTPEGDVIKFSESDTSSPLPPKRHLQINVSMMVQML